MHRLSALCDADNAVLLVIDLQGKIFELCFNHDRLRLTADAALRLADLFAVPVILTEQYPTGLGGTYPALRERFDGLATADKHLLAKTSFGCCGDPGFSETLGRVARAVRDRRSDGPSDRPVDVIVTGIETHVCVQQTVLELLRDSSYRVIVLQDGVGGRLEANHRIALERFRQCGAALSCFESLAFEWTRHKSDPRFKPMSALVKQLAID